MADMNLEQLKAEVRHFAGLAMIGLIEGEAHNPKGMELTAVAEAACNQGLEMVLKLHSKPFQVELAKRLADL
jgi:hypothetical protein